jgi:phospholipid transport system substrate-binding protein
MSRIYTLILTVLLVMPALAGAAWASKEGPGTQAVRNANDTIAKLLRQKAEPGSEAERRLSAQVTTSVRDFLDVDALGRQALVDHWSALSPAQQTRFLSLLRDLIEANYVKGLRANLAYEVAYMGEKKKGDDLVVSTEIKTERRGRPYTIGVDYVLRRDQGKWRAFDVVTDGVGLVENYRAQFNKIIAREGFDGLLARMQKRLS